MKHIPDIVIHVTLSYDLLVSLEPPSEPTVDLDVIVCGPQMTRQLTLEVIFELLGRPDETDLFRVPYVCIVPRHEHPLQLAPFEMFTAVWLALEVNLPKLLEGIVCRGRSRSPQPFPAGLLHDW